MANRVRKNDFDNLPDETVANFVNRAFGEFRDAPLKLNCFGCGAKVLLIVGTSVAEKSLLDLCKTLGLKQPKGEAFNFHFARAHRFVLSLMVELDDSVWMVKAQPPLDEKIPLATLVAIHHEGFHQCAPDSDAPRTTIH